MYYALFYVIALVNGWVFLIALVWLISKRTNFKTDKRQLSSLDSEPSTQILYRISFTFFCFGQILVVYLLSSYYINSLVYLIPLFTGSTLGLLLIIFTTKNHPRAHRVFGGIIFPLVCVGGFVFGIFLMQSDLLVGIEGILITIFMTGMLITFLKTKTIVAKYSLLYFGGLALWNTVNLLPLVYNWLGV